MRDDARMLTQGQKPSTKMRRLITGVPRVSARTDAVLGGMARSTGAYVTAGTERIGATMFRNQERIYSPDGSLFATYNKQRPTRRITMETSIPKFGLRAMVFLSVIVIYASVAFGQSRGGAPNAARTVPKIDPANRKVLCTDS